MCLGGCKRECDYRLQCGHQCPRLCHINDPDHEGISCPKQCVKTCPDGHRCKGICGKCSKQGHCQQCKVMVDRKLPNCNHTAKMQCYWSVERFQCNYRSDTLLPCGHQSNRKCHDSRTNQSPEKCVELLPSQCPLGHPIRIQCHQKNDPAEAHCCSTKCSEVLPCGDRCRGTCSGCRRGRLHEPCRAKCTRPLVCGHECSLGCPARCGPCSRPCRNSCEHSKCKLPCGEPCAPCQERCRWSCRHFRCTMPCSAPCNRPPCNERCMRQLECRHFCAGLCGEKCPRLCYRCDYKQLTQIFFGTEDEPNARFIELEDCGHVFEVSAFDKYMGLATANNDNQRASNSASSTPPENEEIQLKTCPQCKTPIRKSGRYKSIVNHTLHDVELAKWNVRGELFPGDLEQRFSQFNLQMPQVCSSLPNRIFIFQMVEAYNSSSRKSERRVLSADSIAYLQCLVTFSKTCQRLNQLANSQCPEPTGEANNRSAAQSEQATASSISYSTCRANLIRNIKSLESWLKIRRQRFSDFELTQFEAEQRRSNHWINLLMALHCWQSNSNNGMP